MCGWAKSKGDFNYIFLKERNKVSDMVQYRIIDEEYGEICINRPEKHNAITTGMVEELSAVLQLAKQDSIKFLVITGSGNEMFCAGGDLHNLHGELMPDEAFQRLYPMKEILHDIVSFPVPTICLLNGDALGGGCEIATACDIRIAKESTKFGFVQTRLGIIPGWGGGAILYEKVNPSFALQWIMEAEILNAAFLLDRGWIHRIVTNEVWDNREALLKAYLSKSHKQMLLLKSQYKLKLSSLGLSSLMNEEVRNCANLWDSVEHKEALQQFLSRK